MQTRHDFCVQTTDENRTILDQHIRPAYHHARRPGLCAGLLAVAAQCAATLLLPARKAAALVALLVALAYALLSGFEVPAQRTVYMVASVAIALWLNRNFSLGQILSIALLGVLIPDPWAILSPGFWLSFGAV